MKKKCHIDIITTATQELFSNLKQNETINFELKNNLNIFVKRAYHELNGTIKDVLLIEWQFM